MKHLPEPWQTIRWTLLWLFYAPYLIWLNYLLWKLSRAEKELIQENRELRQKLGYRI